jgi:N-succinyldiaminopimelate aminotransferase
MTAVSGLEALAHGGILSPFTRIERLLAGIAPGHTKPIEMTVGDPKEAMPGFVFDKMADAKHLL